MRLNFSGVREDEIIEGIRRIGQVAREMLKLYETMTSKDEMKLPPPESTDGGGSEMKLPPREDLP
jgi:hypothetical protein